MHPTAVVMNMSYTGLGIARSLGEQGIPVIGLSAQHGIAGNFTRYAKTVIAPDSRNEPEALAAWMLQMGKDFEHRAVVFPTRDHDVLFLDRYREELNRYFILVVPESPVIKACLDKWETYMWAQRCGLAAPKSWLVEKKPDLLRITDAISYPCVLKPVSAHQWRAANRWQAVGSRKAIVVSSPEQLLSEYEAVARFDPRVLVQEEIPGGDHCLVIAACYMDRKSEFVAGFNTQKLLQIPEGYGTGCIVQAVDRPELHEPTVRLLQKMGFSGIAEVEYKLDARSGEYQLIEINPRPWDQHRLGKSCGTDLIYLAYCDYAVLARPSFKRTASDQKWIADDAFLLTVIGMLWKRDARLGAVLRLARGKRMYGIWSVKDPLPLLALLFWNVIPALFATGLKVIRAPFAKKLPGETLQKRGLRLWGRY